MASFKTLTTRRSSNAVDVNDTIVLSNNREKRENKEQLKAQILKAGEVIQELRGYYDPESGKIAIISGRGRRECVLELIAEGHTINPKLPIKCYATPITPEDYAKLLVLEVTDNDGEPMKPFEIGKIAKELIDKHGYTQDQAALELGRTAARIGQLISIYSQPESIQKSVENDEISITLAAEIVQKHGDHAAEMIETAIVEAKQSGKKKATEKHVKAVKERSESAKTIATDTAPKPPSKAKILEDLCKQLLESVDYSTEDESEKTIAVSIELLNEISALLN
ncbi:ParB/RepB/Spo0J family partition protein [Chroococcidiopsis sp.]|uniref:ParB/RepB/Spo0J family partition protein n=1 Tax=Chroococcidiopsis sp. TaxID=3088168 RepID=UPI003F31AF9D